MNKRVEYLVNKLGLLEHPEGGFFKEVYRSKEVITDKGLPQRFDEDRVFVTDIFYLLPGDAVSRFHRIKADELWHFFEGSPLEVHMINRAGDYSSFMLGCDLEKGECYQNVVPAGNWFGASTKDPDSYSLVSCTVAPGFEFQDLEIANKEDLLELYPRHTSIINKLCIS